MKLIADNLRITRPEIRRALQRMDPEPVQALVKSCEARGAWAIDVNTGPLGKQADISMTFFIEAVQAVTDLHLLIDTANPDAMAAGVAKERVIIDPVIPPLAWADGIIQAKDNVFSWGMVS